MRNNIRFMLVLFCRGLFSREIATIVYSPKHVVHHEYGFYLTTRLHRCYRRHHQGTHDSAKRTDDISEDGQ